MSKHTPGPWTSDETEAGWLIYAPTTCQDVVWTEDMTDEDRRLMTAAPDMLEALRAALASLRTFSPAVPKDEQDWTSYDEDVRNVIEDIIANLEGTE